MTEPTTQILRYVGFREETVRGTAETTPEMHLDVKSCTPGAPSNPEMDFEGSRGRGKTLHRPGYYVLSPSFETAVDMKVLSRMLYGALGERVTQEAEGGGSGLDPEIMSYYDASADTFTSKKTAFKNATANDVDVPGHAAAEVGDYLLWGDQDQFLIIAVTTGTAKTDTSTLVWEYWDGDSWATLSVSDGTVGFTETGEKTVTWTAPEDWEKRSINNSAMCYFVRCRCSAFSTAATAGAITSGTIGTAPDSLAEYIYSTEGIMLPSWTIFMGLDIDEHILAGEVIDKFELSADGSFLGLKIDGKAQTEDTDTLKAIDELEMNEDYPLAWYDVNLYIRDKGDETAWGSTHLISSDVKKVSFSISNSISEADGQRIGSRFPGYLPAAARDISLSFDYLYISNDWIEKLNGGSVTPGEGISSTEFEMMLEIDAGEYGLAQLYFPRVIVTSAPLSGSGRTQLVQNIQVNMYMDEVVIPTTEPDTVETDILATITHYFPDTTGSFDGVWPPAES